MPDPAAECAVVALDVGGTTIKAGILGSSAVHDLRRVPTPRERGPDAVLDTVRDTIVPLLELCGERALRCVGVGVAIPGVVDEAGVGELSVTMGWCKLPVRQRLEAALGRAVLVEHDVRAGALAEATFGAAAPVRTSLFIPVGTGIAAAIVRDGEVAAGDSCRAGELGQVLVPAPRVDASDSDAPLVTLEAASSALAIAQRYARAIGDAGGPATAETVVRAMADGDARAEAVWTEAIDRLGWVLAAAVATIDPGIIVLGGGLGRAGAVLTDSLRESVARYLPWRAVPPLVAARFGDDAGFFGCGIRAWRAAGLAVDDLAELLGGDRWRVLAESARARA